jgi:hypothetical protein
VSVNVRSNVLQSLTNMVSQNLEKLT